MGTRSTISIANHDGTVHSVYCNRDGYLSYNGAMLSQHYATRALVNVLISHGAISSLRKEIGEHHNMRNSRISSEAPAKDWTKFYHRDGNEELSIETYSSREDFLKNCEFQEYNYLFDLDDVWYVDRGQHDSAFIPVAFAMLAVETG